MTQDNKEKNNRGRSVCAIIVTWNSGEDIKKSLPAISPQVDKVVVVDNGSRPDQFTIIQATVALFNNATIIRNKKNKGLAQALNLGGEYATKKSYDWIITLDDAANPESDMVKKLFSAYDTLSSLNQEKTAVLAPNYVNIKGPVYPICAPAFTTTAVQTGQLVKTNIWEKVGGYKEDLFITWIDHEFCFRVGHFGYKILLVSSAMLEETAGANPTIKSIFGKKFVVPNYSPSRYYYMYRNSVYVYRIYWRQVPHWLFNNFKSEVFSFIKIILFEKNKLKKIFYILRGYFDGLRNKYGELT